MNRDEKGAAVDALEKRIKEVTAVYLADYSGLTVEESNDLRRQFRAAGVSYVVAKNTFIRLAMERLGGYEDVLDYLEGPTAIAFTDDPAAPARIIRERELRLRRNELARLYHWKQRKRLAPLNINKRQI